MESTRFFLPRAWQDPPNAKSDLFAFGSVLYYIMTGREPYDTLSDEEVMRIFEQRVFPDVGKLQCGSTIKGCWAEVFESSEDMLKALLADGLVALDLFASFCIP